MDSACTTLALSYRGPIEPARIVELLTAFTGVLTGRVGPVVLTRESHVLHEDPNAGRVREEAFSDVWTAHGVRLEASVRPGSGNPRDGWGFELAFVLAIESDPARRVVLRDSGWNPWVSSAWLEITPVLSLAEFDALHAVATHALGDASDDTYAAATARQNARWLIARGEHAWAAMMLERAGLAPITE